MHVVHITSNHRPTDIRIFRKMCRSLVNRGHKVTYIVPGVESQFIDGVELHALPHPSSRLARLLLTPLHAFTAALSFRADIYHFHDPELLPVARLLGALRPDSIILYDMHENMPLAIQSKSWIPLPLRGLAYRAYRIVERILLRHLPVVFAEDSYYKYYDFLTRSATVRNFPIIDDVAVHRVAPSEQSLNLVYIGGVTPHRGSRTMLEVLRVLHNRGAECNLAVIGPVEDSEMLILQEQIEALQLEDHVTFLGYLPPNEAWKAAAFSSVGLALLSPEPNYVESFPTKVFEYMCLGLAVVCSDFPLYKSLVDDTKAGVAVDPTNVHEIANAIEQYLANPSLLSEAREHGISAVIERYNWDSEFSALETLYNELLLNRSRGLGT